MASNGRLPASSLARIPGSGPYGGPKLRKDVARAYNAMHNEAMVRWGISMALHEGAVGQSYRSYDRQVLAKKIYGSNAATPGTSNHGWGINVDLETRQQRWVIDKIGRKYGFSKSWSDASWEWWHITYQAGHFKPGREPYPVLRYHRKHRRVKYLQYLLRKKGYKKVPKKGSKYRGNFGAATRDAVKAWQRKKGLKPDGIVGPATWRTLVR
jgi:hypothetical protein